MKSKKSMEKKCNLCSIVKLLGCFFVISSRSYQSSVHDASLSDFIEKYPNTSASYYFQLPYDKDRLFLLIYHVVGGVRKNTTDTDTTLSLKTIFVSVRVHRTVNYRSVEKPAIFFKNLKDSKLPILEWKYANVNIGPTIDQATLDDGGLSSYVPIFDVEYDFDESLADPSKAPAQDDHPGEDHDTPKYPDQADPNVIPHFKIIVKFKDSKLEIHDKKHKPELSYGSIKLTVTRTEKKKMKKALKVLNGLSIASEQELQHSDEEDENVGAGDSKIVGAHEFMVGVPRDGDGLTSEDEDFGPDDQDWLEFSAKGSCDDDIKNDGKDDGMTEGQKNEGAAKKTSGSTTAIIVIVVVASVLILAAIMVKFYVNSVESSKADQKGSIKVEKNSESVKL